MTKSIRKFNEYLNELYGVMYSSLLEEADIVKEKLNKEKLQFTDIPAVKLVMNKTIVIDNYNNMLVVKTLKDLLNCDLNKGINGKMLFNDFDTLSHLLNYSNLNSKEQMEIIIYFIERNIRLGILVENQSIIYEFKNSDKANEVRFNKYYELLSKDDDKLSDKEKSEREKLSKYFEKYIVDYSKQRDAHEKIKEYYIDKKKLLTYEDIDIIVENLRKLKVLDEICEKVKCVLKKEIDKKMDKKSTSINIKFQTDEDIKIKYEENKKLSMEVDKYFDFRNMTSTRFLTMTEVLYVVSLLRKLKYEENTIREFLKISEYKMNKQNIITRYVQLRPKLEYYKLKYGMSAEVENLDSCFKELFIACDEDYNFWKSELEENLRNALKYIPNSYEYELKNR